MKPDLTKTAYAEMDRIFELRNECVDILKLVVAEWSSDPTSVQCFDLRTIERAKFIIASLKRLDPLF